MKRFWGCIAAACAAWASVEAQVPAAAATNAPAAVVSTNVPAGGTNQAAAVAAVIPPAAQEWTGYVRVLRGAQGEVRAVRLVVDDKLVAVDLNAKAQELATTPKTRKVRVKGVLEEREGRGWLVVSEFKDAPAETISAPIPVPVAVTNTPPVASTNATPAAVSTNAPVAATAVAPAP